MGRLTEGEGFERPPTSGRPNPVREGEGGREKTWLENQFVGKDFEKEIDWGVRRRERAGWNGLDGVPTFRPQWMGEEGMGGRGLQHGIVQQGQSILEPLFLCSERARSLLRQPDGGPCIQCAEPHTVLAG